MKKNIYTLDEECGLILRNNKPIGLFVRETDSFDIFHLNGEHYHSTPKRSWFGDKAPKFVFQILFDDYISPVELKR